MQEHRITIPELALFAVTRGMLGAGIGLLAAERLGTQSRRTLGWTLAAIGAASTIPFIVRWVLRERDCERAPRGPRTVAGG